MPTEPPRQAPRPLGFAAHPPRPTPSTARDFAQPHHRDDEQPSTDNLENGLREIVVASARQPEPPTTTEAVLDRAVGTLDLVTAHVLEKIGKLREQLDEIENFVTGDTTRIKNELNSHVAMAQRAAAQTDSLESLIRDLRAERAQNISKINK